MIEKRGQVTIFIIIGVIIVASVGVLIAFSGKNLTLKSDAPASTQPVYDLVQECFKEVGKVGLGEIGKQGGYFILMDDTPSIDGRIPYYVDNGTNLMPSKELIGNHLAGFIQEELPFCIKNFKNYTYNKSNITITHEIQDVNVSFIEENVVIRANYAISLRINNNSYSLNDFRVEIPFDFNLFYSKLNASVQNVVTYYPEFCLTCLYDLSSEKKIYIDMLPYGNSTLFTITDKEIYLNKEPYSWSFATK